jgi:hypothetical protein
MLDSSGRPPLGKKSLKSVNFDHEIVEIGLICSDLIENSHYSCNPGQNPV